MLSMVWLFSGIVIILITYKTYMMATTAVWVFEGD